jgi:hypothetical protein
MYTLEDITVRRTDNIHYIEHEPFESFLGRRNSNSYIKFNGKRYILRRVTVTDYDDSVAYSIRAIDDGFFFLDNGVIHYVRHADLLF